MKKRGMMITAISAATAMLVSTAAPVLADAYTIANTPKCIGISWWDRMEVGNKRYQAMKYISQVLLVMLTQQYRFPALKMQLHQALMRSQSFHQIRRRLRQL